MIDRIVPNTKARESACPPTAKASDSLPEARLDDTKGVVAVHKKLNR